jgi:hypothetical protein
MSNFRDFLTSVVLVATLAAAFVGEAADQPSPPTAAFNPVGAAKDVFGYGIHGKLTGVDPKAMTFSLKGVDKDAVFRIDASTKITKHGQPVALADGTIGEIVAGYVEMQPDGTVVARSLRFGPRTHAAAAQATISTTQQAARGKPGNSAPK